MPYTCPTCGITSHHPKDVEYRYCGKCHKFEGDDIDVVGMKERLDLIRTLRTTFVRRVSRQFFDELAATGLDADLLDKLRPIIDDVNPPDLEHSQLSVILQLTDRGVGHGPPAPDQGCPDASAADQPTAGE